MKYYVIAGEASGDLHGSNLIRAIHQFDAAANLQIWGGDLMEAAGGKLRMHYRNLAFMGFVEVARNIRIIAKNLKFCKQDILDFQPDALILIDYPGFNLRIATWAKKQGFKVIYYISPTIWAWHTSRIHQIKKAVDQMFVILPFEPAFYEKYDYPVQYLGHPLIDVISHRPKSDSFLQKHQLSPAPIIALLPGSRKQEISKLLAEMLKMVSLFPDYQFIIAAAPAIEKKIYEEIIQQQDLTNHARLHVVYHQTYDLLQHAHAALVTSGTATLETALFKVPQVVCYKTSALTFAIARQLVNISYISLVNLIANKVVVKELLQEQMNTDNLQLALQEILNPIYRKEMKIEYTKIEQQLGESGVATRIAGKIWSFLNHIN
ncbi:MAG: lipid-A-disaccharide synthase [Saprospiraceae bacterium]|nr:lipid-A-disaccharide synthase [Saprospiraceae bacterium]